jgi:hypothetical protein
VYRSNADMIRAMRANPAYLMEQRSFYEAVLRERARSTGEELLRLLHGATAYLSNLIGGPVPVLFPRIDMRTLKAANGDGPGAALALGRVVQQLVRSQGAEEQDRRNEHLLAEIEHMVAHAGFRAVPANKKHLDSTDVAGRLGLHPKTVRRLFAEQKLIGTKLASGEWRTTEADLAASPYLKKHRRPANASVE